ncbi:AraC family transcriptional regulator [Saccharothrix luteola]|uniref:AraC family transcriptional regulator n=1 Tax=Saccharothrix luteola TaxID=2893018 RepID=UPI001E5D15A6|nr:AraC family transcriptional regulator [Saccharothrix luteola]MCC8251101.1 AraC family transcriptional regulator [Saccharothrix luteola]
MRPEELAHLRRARDLMDREYARPPDVPAMARAALMSPSHFARQFKPAYGETPCTSLGSFSSRFTELVGETPSAYRARRHDEVAAVPACWSKMVTRPSRFREARA